MLRDSWANFFLAEEMHRAHRDFDAGCDGSRHSGARPALDERRRAQESWSRKSGWDTTGRGCTCVGFSAGLLAGVVCILSGA